MLRIKKNTKKRRVVITDPPAFKNKVLQSMIDEIQRRNPDGTDKTWVHRLRLSQMAHYRVAKRRKYSQKAMLEEKAKKGKRA